jgi:type II secretory pathway predicted ATPase ExeA
VFETISATRNQEKNLRAEVMQHYGLTVPLNQAGYFETTHHQQLMKDIKGANFEGRLIAVCGVIGSGKTMMLRRLQQALEDEKRVTVSKSLGIEASHQAGNVHCGAVL